MDLRILLATKLLAKIFANIRKFISVFMSKNLNPKCKQCRRLGVKLCSKGERGFTQKCALTRRNYPPGVHGPKGYPRKTDYCLHLAEKQKLKLIYGLMERQLRKYFDQANKSKENTGLKMIEILERRLDNVIYHFGLASSRRQARQLINHNHFLLNNKKMNIPSHLVKKNDIIKIKKDRSLEKGPIAQGLETISKKQMPDWIVWDSEKKQGNILEMPAGKDLEIGIDTRLVVEYYSR